jgi:membrane-bound serine protease (ClpP class)
MAMVDPDVEVRQVRVENELVLLDREAWDDLKESGKPYELVRTIAARGQLLNLTARQAVELRFADGIADTLPEVLARVGHAAGDAAPALERSAGDRTVVWIERLAPLLVLMGLVLGYLEFKLPGFGLAGILSAACFLTVVAGKYLAGLADVPHVVAVALGLALIVVELLVAPGTLWFGLVGAVLVAGGLVTASLGPGFSFTDPLLGERLLDTGIEYALAAVLAVIVAITISRWLPKTPVLRRVILAPETAGAFAGALPETSLLPAVGAIGRALTDLRPVGKVAFDARGGTEYEARSLGPFLVAGARVRVLEVEVGRLVVEAAAEERT